MKKAAKTIVAAVTALAMVISMAWISPAEAAESTKQTVGTVTLTMEKFTIGQGYLMEPVQVSFAEGDTVADVLQKEMKANGYVYDGGTGDYGFYLTSIDKADSGILDIPQEIAAMPSVTSWDGSVIDAPSNEKNIGNALANQALGEYSYSSMAGWLVTMNNESLSESADQVIVKSGDVIRCQFSVFGWGADLGFDTESYTGIPKVILANEDALLREVAAVRAKYAGTIANSTWKKAYDSALRALSTYDVSQAAIDLAYIILKQEVAAAETTTAAEVITTMPGTTVTETTTYPSVKRASISSIKNVKKYKAKISVKKIQGVSGYQFKYATNKKLKKATIKSTTAAKLTTKKFKKKQRCYVKVRAFIRVGNTKVYGTWSKVKSVKIKK